MAGSNRKRRSVYLPIAGLTPEDKMLRTFAAVLLGFMLLQSGAAWAAIDCSPHCDYYHDYGPYDFTYAGPGLFGFPVCDWHGNCSPHLVYQYSGVPWHGVIIVVRPTRWRR
jgi:hypothetical protein